MALSVISNLIIFSVLIGYSYLFKRILFKKKDHSKIYNLDIFYGCIFLIFLSIFLNFFVGLKYIKFFVSIFGFFLFLFAYYKKKIAINFSTIFLIITIFTIISVYSSNNVDSPMYHLQILKWQDLNKIIFGLTNLEIRFGMTSTWHSLISITDLSFRDYSAKYYLSSIFFGVLIYETIQLKKEKPNLSYIFLFFSVFFLISFSIIHPFENGIILNHLGNPELDLFPMILFILAIFKLIQLIEVNPNYERSNENDKLIFLIISFICITSRTVYLALLIPCIILILKNKKKLNFPNIFLVILSCFWMIKNFISSSCLIFPYKLTCLNTNWSSGIQNIDYHLKEAMSYARDAPLRSQYKDFDYTLNSMEWVIPWFKGYFFQTSFLIIFLAIILFSVFAKIIGRFVLKKKSLFHYNKYKIVLIILLLSLIIWFLAPEVRLGWGILIALPIFLFSFTLFKLNLNIVPSKKFFSITILLILFLFLFKNFDKFQKNDLFKTGLKVFNYSNIKKLGTYDKIDIYVSLNWQCADFEKFCVNKPKSNYHLKEKYSYLFINAE